MDSSRETKTTQALLKMYANFVEHLGILKPAIHINPVVLLPLA